MVNLKWVLPYLLVSLPIYGGYKEQNKKENMKFFVEYVASLSCVQTLEVLNRENLVDKDTNIVYICNKSGKELLKELEKNGQFDQKRR